MEGTNTDIRIALMGSVGSGKSASGNTILGRNEFTEYLAGQAGTQACRRETTRVRRRNVSIIDTPGLFSESKSEGQLRAKMKKCALLSFPGLHVFLLVIRLDVRLTDEEKNIVRWIKSNFGEDAARYTFILFTHDDQLNGTHLNDYIRENPDLQSLINSCDGRYHSFNNRERANQDQVTILLEKIERMMEINKTHHHTGDEFKMAQQRIQRVEIGVSAGLLGITTLAVFFLAARQA